MSTEMRESNGDKIRELERRYMALLELRIKDLEATVNKTKEGDAGPGTGPPATGQAVPPANASGKDDLSGSGTSEVAGHQSNDDLQPLCRIRQRPQEPTDGSAERDLENFELTMLGLESIASKNGHEGPAQQLTWVRIVDKDGKYSSSEVLVDTPELKALLSVALEAYPNLHFSTPDSASSWGGVRGPIVFSSHCEPLIHNWERLTELAAQNPTRIADMKLPIERLGPRTDISIEDQKARALVYLGKSDNLTKGCEHLGRLLKLVKLLPELSKYFQSLEGQNNSSYVQFEYLWTIFPPGEIVYSTLFMDEPQLFIVKDSTAQFKEEDDEDDDPMLEKDTRTMSWLMVAWSYDWDGTRFKRVPVQFQFEQFTGSKVISTLHCHPFKFHKPRGSNQSDEASRKGLEQVLLKRGQNFKQVCEMPKGSQMFDYEGAALSHGAGFKSLGEEHDILRMILRRRHRRSAERGVGKRQRIRGQVMVDFGAYLQYSPRQGPSAPIGSAVISRTDNECRCALCLTNSALGDSQKMHYDGVRSGSQFEDLQFMICPPRVLGYHLESRTWVELNAGYKNARSSEGTKEKVRYLTDAMELHSDKAFNKLQLSQTQKKLIEDLVKSHSSGTNLEPLMTDIIKGKGKGLVILLHGPPGVGKTLTAESVAQLAGKPLFSVGASDIGLQPAEVEKNLETLFELAANWQAVLLFDEADVFLESRSSHTADINRNALVSVLLRVLEYYAGILILTTNRIREFDIAVQSRVNLGIKYDDLDRQQKLEIFSNFINQLEQHQVDNKEEIIRWFKEDEDPMEWFEALNGRQIRNVLFSAASLGQKSGGQLTKDHFIKMAKSTAKFHDSLKAVVEDARRRAEVGRK